MFFITCDNWNELSQLACGVWLPLIIIIGLLSKVQGTSRGKAGTGMPSGSSIEIVQEAASWLCHFVYESLLAMTAVRSWMITPKLLAMYISCAVINSCIQK